MKCVNFLDLLHFFQLSGLILLSMANRYAPHTLPTHNSGRYASGTAPNGPSATATFAPLPSFHSATSFVTSGGRAWPLASARFPNGPSRRESPFASGGDGCDAATSFLERLALWTSWRPGSDSQVSRSGNCILKAIITGTSRAPSPPARVSGSDTHGSQFLKAKWVRQKAAISTQYAANSVYTCANMK